MSKIIERIVKSIGSPSENDLWLKKDGQDLSLNAYDNGEWKLVAGGGGGGGDATDAIKYTEQTLTEDQQMQARKNQGLYAKCTSVPAGTITWDGDTSGLDSVDLGGYYAYKIADSPTELGVDNFISVESTNGEEMSFYSVEDIGGQSSQYGYDIEGNAIVGMTMNADIVVVSTGFTMSQGGTTLMSIPSGVWASDTVRAFKYSAVEEIFNKVSPEYLAETEDEQMAIRKQLGLYYEETENNNEVVHQIPSKFIPDSHLMFKITNVGLHAYSVPSGTYAKIIAAFGQMPIIALYRESSSSAYQSNMVYYQHNQSYKFVYVWFATNDDHLSQLVGKIICFKIDEDDTVTEFEYSNNS